MPTRRLLLAAALVVAGCGAPSTDPVVGTWVLDVERTLSASLDATQKPAEGTLRAVTVDFAPEAYRFDLDADGTFTLAVGTSGEPFVMRGAWTRSDDTVALVTTEAGGIAVTGEGAAVAPPCRLEGDAIVLVADGREMFLRRP